MRKVFTLFILFCCVGLSINAQMLATFEDGEDENVNWAISLGNATDGGQRANPDLFIEGGVPDRSANLLKEGLNTSEKCLVAINVANADWWQNFATIQFIEPVTITESNRYLRYMAYRSIQPKNFRVAFNGSQDPNQIFQGKVPKEGVWVGMVADVINSPWAKALLAQEKPLELEYMQLILSNNWDDPRNGWGVATYMFDNFELTDNPLPPGIKLIDGNGLYVGFESQDEMDKWLNVIDLQSTDNECEIIDNPFTSSAVNSGGKIFKLDKGKVSWWKGPRFEFDGLIPVKDGAPNQLHVAVLIPEDIFVDGKTTIDVQLCAKDHMGNENTQIFSFWDDEVGDWLDLVMELDKIEYLQEVTVRFDLISNDAGTGYVDAPANTYYIDAIELNGDPAPREKIIAGLPKVSPLAFAGVITLPETIQVNANQNVNVQVYDLLGSLIKSTPAIGTTNITVGRGIYIVNVTSASGQKYVTKVLVK